MLHPRRIPPHEPLLRPEPTPARPLTDPNVTVWLAVGLSAGAWYFWPIWPILGAGIGLAAHAIPVRSALRPPT